MASAEKIAATLENWRIGKDVPETTPEIQTNIMVFLRCLAHLKKCHAALSQLRPLFQEDNSEITAQHLMIQLFRLVFFFMYRPESF
jgi:hypothetical protein